MACLPVASDGALGEAACYAPTAHTPQALTVDPAGAFVYAGGAILFRPHFRIKK